MFNSDLKDYLKSNVSESSYETFSYLFNMLEENGHIEIIEMLNDLVSGDELDIEPLHINTDVTNILQNSLKSLFMDFGFIIDESMALEYNLSSLARILKTLKHINSIEAYDANSILELYTNDELHDDIDLLHAILNIIDNEIDSEVYYNVVMDITPTLLRVIKDKALSLIDTDDEISDNDIKILNNVLYPIIYEIEIENLNVHSIVMDVVLSKNFNGYINNVDNYIDNSIKSIAFYYTEEGDIKTIMALELQNLVLCYYVKYNDYINKLLLDLYDRFDVSDDVKTIIEIIDKHYKNGLYELLDKFKRDNDEEG